MSEEKQFLYQFLPGSRPELATQRDAWTEADSRIAEAHAAYLEQAADDGIVILAGRSQDGVGPAIVVIEVEDEEAARRFMENDPFVRDGLFRASLHPYRAAFMRKDVKAAHRYFSVQCFNRAWELIEKMDRSPDEDEEMIRLSLASHWHWTQREDYTRASQSIAHWQTSRIYSSLGQPDNARRYGQLCLEASQGDDAGPFFLGYAYEALARAEAVAGNRAKMEDYAEKARQAAGAVPEPDDKKQLLDDLDSIRLG